MAGTTWTEFVAGTKAKSSQVNENFDWIEEHLFPMKGGSTTTGVYDLGSTLANWRDLYLADGGRVFLDGGDDSYLIHSTTNTIDIFVAGVSRFRVDGVDDEINAFSSDFTVDALRKIFFDGGGGSGNTYIVEGTTDRLDFVVGGITFLQLSEAGVDNAFFLTDISVEASSKIYLDGRGDTYIQEFSPDRMDFVVGSSTMFVINQPVALVAVAAGVDFAVQVGDRSFLDGGTHTYWIESSNDVIKGFAGAAEVIKIDANGIATNGNESVDTDIVIFSLDGTTPDVVGYVVDESKVVGITSVGHASATVVTYISDEANTSYTHTSISIDSLTINYGSDYGSGDAAHVSVKIIP